MRTWEYKKIALNEGSRRGDDIDLLCDAGEQGWELVAVLPHGVAYLKREVVQKAVGSMGQSEENVKDVVTAQMASTTSRAESMSHVKPRYRDAVTGQTWSGRGRMASWLKRKVDAGEDIEKYLV